jgi:hypothetical protein
VNFLLYAKVFKSCTSPDELTNFQNLQKYVDIPNNTKKKPTQRNNEVLRMEQLGFSTHRLWQLLGVYLAAVTQFVIVYKQNHWLLTSVGKLQHSIRNTN